MVTSKESREITIHVDDGLSAIEYCYEAGWTDGLPVIPPTMKLVDAMLDTVGIDPLAVIGEHVTTRRSCTAHAAAVNAVMAGCLPAHFPIVIAALKAMSKTDFNYHGSTASTGGSSHLIVVSGPIADEIGMNATGNLFGSGNRANAAIGRTIRLIHLNVFHMQPNVTDKSTQGNPGKYSLCVAERSDRNPWPLLHEEFGYPDDSIVVVFAAGGFHNVENHFAATPEQALLTMSDSMSCLDSLTHGQSVVVLSPETAEIVAADASWTKSKVQNFLFANAYRENAALERIGRPTDTEEDRSHYKFSDDALKEGLTERYHRGLNAEDILLFVGGGDAGAHSAFLPSWSRGRNSIMQSEVILRAKKG
jgi:hypothetical protein